MENNIYLKLSRMREAVKKEEFNSFPELMSIISKKAKHYKLLPLYCFYDKVATLSIVDMDNIAMVIKFQIPVELVGMGAVKECLYKMAFDIETVSESITPKQYIALLERMKERNVPEKDILERYHLKSLADLTPDVYQRCMTVLDRMKNK